MNASAQLLRWHAALGEASFRETALRWILNAAQRAISARGCFDIVLAGGNTPHDVYAMLRDANADWSRWRVWFGDERCLPADDPQRNSAMAGAAFLDHVPIPRDAIHAIAAEVGADAAAQRYGDELRGVGEFDLVLLGLGEDGHTASLFPGHDLGEAADAPSALAVHGAPKPPSDRVSLSASRLSRAREVLFLADAHAKRAALMRWRGEEDIPARAIRPTAGVDVLVMESALAAGD